MNKIKYLSLSFLILVLLYNESLSALFQDAQNDSLKSVQEIAAFFKKTKGIIEPTLSDLELRLAVSFGLDSDQLTAQAKKQLDNLALVLKKSEFQHVKIELAGHTCDLGSEEYNLDLSQRRVTSAQDYLVNNHEIEAERVSVIAYGENLPLIPGANTEEDRSINRRVVVYAQENRNTIEQMLKKREVEYGFRWAVLQYKGNKTELVKYDGSSILKSGAEYRLFLRPSRTKYVYIYQKDASGKGEWLFPREDMGLVNPMKPAEYFLPNREQVYVLDHTLGKETISIIVSDEAIEELENLIKNKLNSFSEAITQTIKLRGIKMVKFGPAAQSPQREPQTIVISDGAKKKESSTHGLSIGVPQSKVANVLAHYQEFMMVLEFEHK